MFARLQLRDAVAGASAAPKPKAVRDLAEKGRLCRATDEPSSKIVQCGEPLTPASPSFVVLGLTPDHAPPRCARRQRVRIAGRHQRDNRLQAPLCTRGPAVLRYRPCVRR